MNSFHTVTWFQVSLSNTNHFQTYLFDPYKESRQGQSEPQSNNKKVWFLTPQSSNTEASFCVIHKNPPFFVKEGVIILHRGIFWAPPTKRSKIGVTQSFYHHLVLYSTLCLINISAGEVGVVVKRMDWPKSPNVMIPKFNSSFFLVLQNSLWQRIYEMFVSTNTKMLKLQK